jgi:hypothetical protein
VVFRVGHLLYKYGRPFLICTFNGNASVADAINKVLLAGYYLVNAGYSITVLKVWQTVGSLEQMLNVLSYKAGTIVLTLGFMHLFNVLVLLRIGKMKKTINNTNQ